MTEQTNETAPTVDNAEVSTEESNLLATDETVAEPATPTAENDSPYGYVPEKFMNTETNEPDFEKLANSYSELEKKIGSKIGAESTDEYEYEFEHGDVFDSGEPYTQFKDNMLELGLSKEQFAGIMGVYENNTVELMEAMAPSPDRAQEALTKSWGDAYEANLGNARLAWDTFATPEMNIDTIGNSPEILQILSVIGASLGEDTSVGKTNANAGSGLTQTDVNALMNTEDYWTNAESQAKVQSYYDSKN